jgi:phosphoglycerate dehydrogenase-like enzyme
VPECLIVSAAANEFAEEIARLADFRLPVKACTSADRALHEYTGQTIVFGDPDMIASILPKMPSVDWVQSCWAGVTPLMKIDRRDYVLTGVKEVYGPQMSEYVMGYLLAHELKLLERMQQQSRHNWFKVNSGSVHGKRLGIMGTGSIGRHIAETATFFDMHVTGLSRSGEPSPAFEKVMPVDRLHEFLEETDYLVSVLPQTDDTNNLLDEAALARLPRHTYLINVGRSNVIDNVALIDALRNDRLAGAVLDVFDEEPLPQDSPLWDTPNLSITAHIAAVSHPSLIVPIFVENYRRYINKQPLNYIVDFDAGY